MLFDKKTIANPKAPSCERLSGKVFQNIQQHLTIQNCIMQCAESIRAHHIDCNLVVDKKRHHTAEAKNLYNLKKP